MRIASCWKSSLLALLIASSSWAAETVRLEGTLRERGTRTPLGGVNVFVLPHKLKASTDAEGKFAIDAVPAGPFQWVVNFSGYERLEQDDDTAKPEPRLLYLERKSYDVYETTIYDKEQKRDDSTKTLRYSQFAKIAGSGGDPVKAVQNLPGVNRVAGFGSQVVIQGSAPRDTRYTIDGHEVPIIFHFGGLSSVVLPEALDRVDYLSAGYGPEYGRALGGLVGVWSKQPRKDRLGGFGYFDIFNAGGMVEGPVGSNSRFLAGFRQSYIGAVLKAAFKDNKDFNLTAAPDFRDQVALFETELSPIDTFKILGVGSQDQFRFVLEEPADSDPSIRGAFRLSSAFFRLIPQLTHKHGEGTVSRWSLGMGRDWIRTEIGSDYFRISAWTLTARGELERKMSDSWTSIWGFDNRYRWSKAELQVPTFFSEGGVSNPVSSSETRATTVSPRFRDVSLWWRNTLHAPDSPLTLQPSARVDWMSQTRELLPVPRLAARYALDESMSLRSAGGIYYQPPQEGETDATFGNPEVDAPRAWHLAAGVEKDFRAGSSRGFILSGGGFYRYFDRLVIPSTTVRPDGTPENYNNDGKGRAFGAEALLRLEAAPWTGWLSYTISQSTRWNPRQGQFVFAYDQTHLITAIASVELGSNWRISSRVRYVTGNPSTPVTGGVFDADNDVYIPIRGPLNSERLSPFFQTDIRVDKRWIYDRWILSLYLDIQNVTNRGNIEAVQYSYDFTQRSQVTGLPILPTFGIRGDF
jgi:hypothetical protein